MLQEGLPGLKTQIPRIRMYELDFISTFASPNFFHSLKAKFSLNSTLKEPNFSPITKFHRLFNSLLSICVQCGAFSVQSCMLHFEEK